MKKARAGVNRAGGTGESELSGDDRNRERSSGTRWRFSAGMCESEDVFAIVWQVTVDVDRHPSSQELDACRKDRQRVREGVVTGHLPQWPLEEHARTLANLQHWAPRALRAPRPVSRSFQGNGAQVAGVPDPM